LTVVEQRPEPSDGHRCSGVLEDGPRQDLVRLQNEASGPALQVVDGASGSEAVSADEYCFGAVAASSDMEEKVNALSPLASAHEAVERHRHLQDELAHGGCSFL
jgi:hypothetical protein